MLGVDLGGKVIQGTCSEATIFHNKHSVFTSMACLFVVACGRRDRVETGEGLTPSRLGVGGQGMGIWLAHPS